MLRLNILNLVSKNLQSVSYTHLDDEIIEVVENYGLKVPFKRPDYLATDQCSTYDVLLHALDFYESINRKYKKLILLQPTSPFRTKGDVEKASALYSNDIDMVVSVTDASGNYYKERCV